MVRVNECYLVWLITKLNSMNKVLYNKLGRRIRELRVEKGLTQEQLAELAGINAKFEGRIEKAINKPSLDTIFKLAKALDVEVVELFKFNNH